MVMGLDRLPPGSYAIIVKHKGSKAVMRCFQEWGLTPGCRVYCRYRSPGGKIIVLDLGDATIALQTRELRNIKVITI